MAGINYIFSNTVPGVPGYFYFQAMFLMSVLRPLPINPLSAKLMVTGRDEPFYDEKYPSATKF